MIETPSNERDVYLLSDNRFLRMYRYKDGILLVESFENK
jgi:hypothetical protein